MWASVGGTIYGNVGRGSGNAICGDVCGNVTGSICGDVQGYVNNVSGVLGRVEEICGDVGSDYMSGR